MSDVTSAVVFYGVSLATMLAALPMIALLCRPLGDRGASLARPISLLALVWPVWLLAGLFPGTFDISRRSLWICFALLAAGSWTVGWRFRVLDRDLLRHVVRSELIFLGGYVAYLGYRGLIPAANLFEQPFNLMMLSSTMKSNAVPPPDGWLSGYPINYYYLNYQVFGSVAKMGGLVPAHAFNPALAITAGMVVSCAAGLARNVLVAFGIRQHLGRLAGLAVVFIVFIGTPYMSIRAMQEPDLFSNIRIRAAATDRSYRLLPAAPVDTITESIWVSLRTANLHPHLMALPFMMTMLALGLVFLAPLHRSGALAMLARAVPIGIVIGALLPQNSWDYPTAVVIVALCMLLGANGVGKAGRIGAIILLGIVSISAWIPFQLELYTPLKVDGSWMPGWLRDFPIIGDTLGAVRFNEGYRTTFAQYFTLLGFLWAILLAYAISLYLRDRAERRRPVADAVVGIAAVVLLVLAWQDSTPVVAAAGIPVVLALAVIAQRRRVTLETAVMALTAIGFAFTIVTEYFYIDDIVGSRVNTVFKYYYQVVLLLGVAAAIALASLLSSVRITTTWRNALTGITAIVILFGSLGPIFGFNDLIEGQNRGQGWRGLDALDYVRRDYPGEYEAIAWLWNHASADDVMLAAGGCYVLDPIGRPTAGSGVPTLLGWAGHEWTWRYENPEFTNDPVTGQLGAIVRRAGLIPDVYRDLRPANLDFYGITLIYVGKAEASGIPNRNVPGGLEPFSNVCAPGPFPETADPSWPGEGWTEVFSQDGTRIYRRSAAP